MSTADTNEFEEWAKPFGYTEKEKAILWHGWADGVERTAKIADEIARDKNECEEWLAGLPLPFDHYSPMEVRNIARETCRHFVTRAADIARPYIRPVSRKGFTDRIRSLLP